MVSMRALECLVAIVEQGSLTRAAAVLHMSQPALSHQIAAIERELGTPVIERLPRGIRPTAAGLAVTAEARVALAAADRAVIAGRRAAAGASGRIRIACAETMTAWVLVPVLRSWRRRSPGVDLDLKEFTSADQMLDQLLPGEADITVGPGPPGPTGTARCSAGRRSSSSPPRSTGSPAWTRCRWPSWRPNRSCTTTRATDSAYGSTSSPRTRRRAAQPALRTGSPRTAAQLAAAGMGVAVVPFSALTPHPGGTVRSLDPPELRDVIVTLAAPHDDLLGASPGDLKQRGLPTRALRSQANARY